MKTTLVCDTECYRDYFLVAFMRVDTGMTRYYEMYDGHPLDRKVVSRILHSYRIVTFNGIKYDMPMLSLAVLGKSCAELKEASDRIILGNLQSWQFEQLYGLRVLPQVDHIDISEVAPGVMVSLKQYAGRMHSRRLQDLPIEPDARISPAQRLQLVDYCTNSDLPATCDLWHKLTDGKDDVIGIRERIGVESGLELRSKSDAQVAEAVIKATVEKIKGERIYKPNIPPGTSYKFKPPAFLNFRTQALQQLLFDAAQADFIVSAAGKVIEPPKIKDREITISNSTYAVGIGGLHSCEKSTAHISDQDFILLDRDVASFYPYLIKTCGLAPRNMGDLFLKIYSNWIDRRIAAKRSGDKTTAQTLKIFLNGLYGKLGSPYSIVYAPDLMIQVTLTGQLVLLMLIERIELAGIRVVSANTDGIVIKCPRHRENELLGIVTQWEHDTGMETEETRYKALFSRDINNYIALKENGGSKTKGVFSPPSLQKNVESEICSEAASKFLEYGVPVVVTIRACSDARKFLVMRKVTGGAVRITKTRYDETLTPGAKRAELLADGWFQVVPGPLSKAKFDYIPEGCGYDVETAYRMHCGEDTFYYMGKVIRWYYGIGVTTALHRKTLNKSGGRDKVASSDGAVPMMNLVDGIPADLDFDRYIRDAEDILRDVGVTPEIRTVLSAQFPNGDLF